jgi:hypothetical protein
MMRMSEHECRNPKQSKKATDARLRMRTHAEFRGAHAPSRAHFGALAEMFGRDTVQEGRPDRAGRLQGR